ncbi:MAG TPA: hypothetical protein VK870_11595 [Ignavibacteriaceae bacterium]|nr:hypothetical protein [Ignavibacteriaceae bacterium]
MKSVFIFFFLLTIHFFSCTDNANNNLFGNLPSIAEKYKLKIDEVQKELSQTTDLPKGRDLSLELLKIKDEADFELRSYFESNLLKLSLPFLHENENELFSIKSIKIVSVSFNQIEIEAEFTAKIDSRNSIFAYLKFSDMKGNDIPGWIVAISKKELKKDSVFTFSGSFTGIEKLVNAEKILIKSREDYERSSSFNN